MLTTTFHFVSPPRQNRLLAITHVNVLPMDNDDTLLVEERYINLRGTRQDTARLVIRNDGTIQEGVIQQETLVGVAQHTITQLAEGGNRVHLKDVDGHEILTLLDQPALIPDERLSITTMPLALTALDANPTSLLALSLGREEPQVIHIDISPASSSILLQQWQVAVEHPGQPSLQHYQVAPDKTLVSMRLEWRGLPWREIRVLAE